LKNNQKVKLEIFIPEEFVPRLREELSKVGVGVVGNYDQTMAVTQVTGYWRPLEGANPYDGKIGKLSSAPEAKVEVTCFADAVRDGLRVIRAVHPYEEPVINVLPLANHLYEGE
jgi:hypothetical protein